MCKTKTSLVLLVALVPLSTGQLSFAPSFPVSQYTINEGHGLVVQLSAPLLTKSYVPSFTGSIEVDIIAEDLPSGDPRQSATFGADYIVNLQDPLGSRARIFTVTFMSKQSNSSRHVIQIADDTIFEGKEYIRCRISTIRFTGLAAQYFKAQDGVTKTSVDVGIEDDDTVQISWTVSRASVTEGDVVRLSGTALGIYANPVAIGVYCKCSHLYSSDSEVEIAIPGKDFRFTEGTKLHFRDVNVPQSVSSNQVAIPIINDDIAEPREVFACIFQRDITNSIQAINPSEAIIEIVDDDVLIVRWAKDFYEFAESTVARVELVTDSKIEVDDISILGFPLRIIDGSPYRISSLAVRGPFSLPVSIERTYFIGREFGNAQVTKSRYTDVRSSVNEFVFTPSQDSSFQSFSIVGDDVLEFDELFIAEFEFPPSVLNNWNVRKGSPSTAFVVIRDDDFVEVNFHTASYSVLESDGHVNVYLRITGKFFIPVYATIEINEGTATHPGDYSGATRYNVTFPQTALTDRDEPSSFAQSDPVSIAITNDNRAESSEYFQMHIVRTSDSIRVRIGLNKTARVIITDDDIVNCGTPPAAPGNGYHSGSGTTYQSTRFYRCNPGYFPTPRPPNTMTCMANGQWSGSVPRCDPITCGSPPAAPANGRRSGSGTTYQSTVTYTCNPGYFPTPPGPNTVTCMANEQWSGSVPRCDGTS